MKIICLLTLYFMIFVNTKIIADNKHEFFVVYTNSLNGQLDSCECKNDPKGGLVKRATIINTLRKTKGQLLLFETGDFFTYDKDLLLSQYIVKAYRYMKYDAMQFGDQEFTIGVKNFLKFRNKLPFVSSNVTLNSGNGFKKYFLSSKIIRRDKIKIGVIGTISKSSFKYYSMKIKKNIEISDQIKVIKREIKKLKRKNVSIFILLSHSGYSRDKWLAKRLSDIDIIIGGHSQTLLKKPVKINNSIIVQAGSDGKRIGILHIKIRNNKIEYYKNVFIYPTHTYPQDNPFIRQLINKYNLELRKKYNKLKF